MGVELKTRPRVNASDKGGKTTLPPIKQQFGATLKAANLGLTVTQVFEGLAAQQAGILVNDVVIAIKGHVVTQEKLQRLLDSATESMLPVVVIRDGRLLNIELPVIAARHEMAYFDVIDSEKLNAWLA